MLSTGDVATQDADRLGQRAHLDVDPAVEVEMVHGAPAVATEDARRMGVVDHDRGRVPVGDIADVAQRRDVAVHAEDAVGDDQDRAVAPRPARRRRVASRRTVSRPSMSLWG